MLYKRGFCESGTASWEKSSIREWLNNDFYNEAFSPLEKRTIQLCETENLIYDYVFIPSVDETEAYMSDISIRTAKPTPFAASTGAGVSDKYEGRTPWWERSPLRESDNYPPAIDVQGIYCHGIPDSAFISIRPELIIRFDVQTPQVPGVVYQFNGHSYVLCDVSYTWEEAFEYAQNAGKDSHLVTISSEEEQRFIESLVSTGTKEEYWIGGYLAEDGFRWITGEELVYSNWDEGEPNNNLGNENYLEIFRIHPFNREPMTWNDADNNNNIFGISNVGFIIEFE